MSIESYLEKLSAGVDNRFGQRMRKQFRDTKGWSELAMLTSPSGDELEQLKKAVAIMTPAEKSAVEELTDEQIQKIAEDAKIDAGIFAIFINGYIIECKRVL